MKPWQRAVAVPLLVLLAGAESVATLHYRPVPAEQRAPSRRPLKPPWTPPLRHGGCQGRFWLQTAPRCSLIAPGMPSPQEWSHRRYCAFGLEIPLSVFRQFALSERTLKDLRHPQNYKSYFTRCCCTQQQRQATAIPGREDLGEEDLQVPDLLSGYQRQRRNRPCATS